MVIVMEDAQIIELLSSINAELKRLNQNIDQMDKRLEVIEQSVYTLARFR